ncbi:precorrin-6Y C(5,15)-methyltransferase [mine drainage metagenome]|uniref:Precorrin-6Y C(5,15)-methyltransferase n=1 Tax=mine drainage metagenome TaxID=410659 RepID=A0A1J5QHE3_9ZZZZ
MVVGSSRLLALLPTPEGATIVSIQPLATALQVIADHDGEVVVLASGDPGFFGLTRTLRALGYQPRVIPALSSVSILAARLGEPWDDAAVMSAHGRDPREAVNAARALPAVFILTSPEFGPAHLGHDLQGWNRELIVGERLGHADETVTTCTPAEATAREWCEPNVVLVVDPTRRDLNRRRLSSNQPGAISGFFAAREDDFVHRDSMITKWEVRAAALSRLAPRFGSLIWDLGAGSGSLAVECAVLGAAVIAVDSDLSAEQMIQANAKARDVDVRVLIGAAQELLHDLPEPDAVFIGGGGLPVLDAVLKRSVPRVVATFAAIDRMTQARGTLISAGYEVEGIQLQSSRMTDLPAGGFRLVATNPTFLLSAKRVGLQ